MKILLITTFCFWITCTCLSQNVGIGTSSPSYKLDLAGRMRIQHTNNSTSGIYFDGPINATRSFVGTLNNDYVGFWGQGSNWNFVMNVNNGNIGIGNTSPNDKLHVNGNYAIVGAWNDDEGFVNNGSATIFKRNTTTGIWESQGKLINPVSDNNDNFGQSVSIFGNYAIVGAHLDDEGGFTNNGSASIFKRNTNTGVWEVMGNKITNPQQHNDDYFGGHVSISGDYIMIGATGEDLDGPDHGSACIYKRYGNNLRLLEKFNDPNGVQTNFGKVAIDGDTRRFVVGGTGVNFYSGMAFFGKVK